MLLVGLGNPGSRYDRTRHNIGFMLLDSLDDRWARSGQGGFTNHGRVKGEVSVLQRMSRKLVLLKPTSYMNLSGGPVQAAAHFYKIPVTNIVVICDDVNLPFGTLRIRQKGGAGGHNGLKSIESSLGTAAYVRIRMGVGGGHPGRDLAGHVLGDFRSDEMERLPVFLERTAKALESMMRRGVSIAMSQFNGNVFEDDDASSKKSKTSKGKSPKAKGDTSEAADSPTRTEAGPARADETTPG